MTDAPAPASPVAASTTAAPMLGAIALGCYLIHGAVLTFSRSEPWHMLWVCHLSNVMIALGLALGSARANAIGVCWLMVGTPLWFAMMAGGKLEFNPTSGLTHVVGLTVGLVGAARIGWPPGSWWRAALAVAGLNLICQLIVPADPRSLHVNLAHEIWPGSLEAYFSGYWPYLVTALGLCGAVFLTGELLLRWLLPRR